MFLRVIENSFYGIPDAIKGFYKTIPVLLIFAADDKTEQATPKKKSEARKKGQIPKSKDLTTALTLLSSTIVITTLGGFAGNELKATMTVFLNNYLTIPLDYNSVHNILLIVLWRLALIFLPIVLPIMFMGMLVSFLQTGALLTFEPLKPSLGKLNPINGLKRMFSMRSTVQLLKDSAIVTVVGFVGYKFIRDNYLYVMSLGNVKPAGIISAIGSLTVSIFFKITAVMLVIAIIDYFYQRYQLNKDLKMTKQEVKEEFKQSEGDPQIKGKIRQKQREMAMRRMMQQVPKATVVVTNPTHISVALKYEKGQNAPIVVAKGADSVAFKIRELAKANDVPIVENKPLARLMYKELELDQEVPVEMYQAVAEILALVYKLKKK
jgi:flagellar biosynthetic protein FliR/FlhB